MLCLGRAQLEMTKVKLTPQTGTLTFLCSAISSTMQFSTNFENYEKFPTMKAPISLAVLKVLARSILMLRVSRPCYGS